LISRSITSRSIFGQFARAAGFLQHHQFVNCFEQQGFVRDFALIVLYGGQKRGVAQIGKRHKAQRFIGRQNLRHVYHVEKLLHLQIRCNAHFIGRRIHADNALAV
jgi:hypothetical protein